MGGFRNGSVTWRAILSRPTSYSSDAQPSRVKGNSTKQIDPKDLLQFTIVIADKSLPTNDPRHRLSVEPGVDGSFVESVKPYCVVLKGPLPYESMEMLIRHMTDLKPGAAAKEIAILILRRGAESIYLVHAPGETVVQKRCPV